MKNCGKISTFDITRFWTSFHRIKINNHDIIIDPIYSKALTFDLDLDSQKKNSQEPFMKPTHETKHDGILQLRYLKIVMVEHKLLENKHLF